MEPASAGKVARYAVHHHSIADDAGCADAEIFEANQVCAYFNYSNRLLNGLGVTTQGDLLGFSPPNTDKLDDWEHQ